MIYRQLTEADYDKVIELDRKVYPTSYPLTPKILGHWHQRNPEFGMVFEKNGKLEGMLISVPLNKKGWQKLIKGELAEADLTSETIFDNSRDKEIGIHIYHIEKIDPKIKEFYKSCLENLSKLIDNLRIKNPKLRVSGLSGLCTSIDGIKLFENKMNFREREYLCQEHILEKNGKKYALSVESDKELEGLIGKGYKLINRCKMLVALPSEPGIIWKYIKA